MWAFSAAEGRFGVQVGRAFCIPGNTAAVALTGARAESEGQLHGDVQFRYRDELTPHGLRSVCDAREDVAVVDSARTCVVCRVTRMRSSTDHGSEAFVCAKCQADTVQLFAIQDRIWGEAAEGSSQG